MLLFLDVISSIPEFFIIEDNKIILQRKITSNVSEKLSDNICKVYLEINNDLKLRENLRKVVITLGPGSYTSLRVGTAFIAGLVISKKLSVSYISAPEIIQFKSEYFNKNNIAVFITSANKQQFICSTDNNKKIIYNKIEKENFILPSNIEKIHYNDKLFKTNNKKIKQYKFSFINELLSNYNKLRFSDNKILKPIYISNNKLLN